VEQAATLIDVEGGSEAHPLARVLNPASPVDVLCEIIIFAPAFAV
jgi:hypothetical protein